MGREVERVRPKSAVLPALIRWHRAPLRFDLAALGVRLEDFPDRISWNYLWDFVSELLRDPSSHLVSAMHGDEYVPSAAERAAWAVFEADVNSRRGQGTSYRRIKRPWAGSTPVYQTALPEHDPDRAARRERLAALF